MAYVIEITEDKMDNLAENAEKMLRYGGKLMHCIEELREEKEERMGERGGMRDYRDGGRYGNRSRGGYREDDDDDGYYGERRGVAGSGRGRY